MNVPRQQDLEYGNMTTDVVENEDGTEILSPCLDNYRRTEAQVEAVREAGKDQRKIGGGVYKKKDGSQKFLTIQKGYMSKDIGLKLVTAEKGQMVASLNCFGTMDYEFFKFSKAPRASGYVRSHQKKHRQALFGMVLEAICHHLQGKVECTYIVSVLGNEISISQKWDVKG